MLEGFAIRDGKQNRYLSVELDGAPESAWEYVLLRYADDRFYAGIHQKWIVTDIWCLAGDSQMC